MTAKSIFKTVFLAICAVGLVFILRRPDLYFSWDLFSVAFYKNVGIVFGILPAYLAYIATRQFINPRHGSALYMTKDQWPEKNPINWGKYVNYIGFVSILIIACALVSVFSDFSSCDEYGDCINEELSPQTDRLMNFIRFTMAAVAGMIAAIVQRD